MKEKESSFCRVLPLVCAVAADLIIFWLLYVLAITPWLAAACAWVLAVCTGFLTARALSGGLPCALDHALNEMVYCGLSGCPTLAVDLAILLLGAHFLPAQIFVWKILGAVICAAVFLPCRAVLQKPLQKLQPILNEETVSYLFFGVLTTVVNIIIHWLLSEKCGVNPMISNCIAWIGSVAFAYCTNRRYVFKSRTKGAAMWKEIGLFLTARLLSLGVDQGGMALCLYVFRMDNMLSKILMNVIVVILNYFASKWMIFGKKEKTE